MEETDELVVGYLDDQYVLLDEDQSVVAVLEPGSVFQVWMAGEWQAVRKVQVLAVYSYGGKRE